MTKLIPLLLLKAKNDKSETFSLDKPNHVLCLLVYPNDIFTSKFTQTVKTCLLKLKFGSKLPFCDMTLISQKVTTFHLQLSLFVCTFSRVWLWDNKWKRVSSLTTTSSLFSTLLGSARLPKTQMILGGYL